MKKYRHELPWNKIHDAEKKYQSLINAPPEVLAEIQQITAMDGDVDAQIVGLTEHQLNILNYVINGEMTPNAAEGFVRHSRTWINARIVAIKTGNYFILEEK
ncbi:hypothetical protein [Lactiplantibacillus pingfangensis]|uniref:hypothetical protein n=1 Tax=Lactiplantibacillus pingfangensis TaxID=2559915 RepID=UPI0010F81655|nr:hypothetical protein [Lactiplantibacillus pingfangensis]